MKIYNTLTKKKEELKTIEKNKVKLYTCGPTVYNYAHIGNLRTYVFEDTLVKTLMYLGYKVKHAMNITDVGHLTSDADEGEDKMLTAAKRENKGPLEIARYYEGVFFEDLKKLNIKKADIVCRATEEIDTMIDLIKTLEKKGYTYVENGNVYFDTEKFDTYGDFANLDMENGAVSRVELDEHKKNPRDFVLWFTKSKFENHILEWDSPWGKGYPGWHIECSAMSIKYLGEFIDIHCGGIDHVKIHHTNEVAQSEAALGHKWVNYWMHGEFINDKDGKMSKSKGDFLTIKLLEDKGFDPLVYRYYLLESRYRKQLTFSFDQLEKAKETYSKLKNKIADLNEDGEVQKEIYNKYVESFKNAIGDDLNTSNAITLIYDVLKENTNNITKRLIIKEIDKVLSLDLFKKETDSLNDEEQKLMDERKLARENKDYAKSDEIRDKLLDSGIIIKDTREGTTWKRAK